MTKHRQKIAVNELQNQPESIDAQSKEMQRQLEETINRALQSDAVKKYIQWFVEKVRTGYAELLSHAKMNLQSNPDQFCRDGVEESLRDLVYCTWMEFGESTEKHIGEYMVVMLSAEIDPLIKSHAKRITRVLGPDIRAADSF